MDSSEVAIVPAGERSAQVDILRPARATERKQPINDSTTSLFSAGDLAFLDRLGIPLEEIDRQLEQYRNPPPPLNLVKACRLEDGIRQLDNVEQKRLEELGATATDSKRVIAFVPASGAASRMFKLVAESTPETQAQLLDALRHLPFFLELSTELSRDGLRIDALVEAADFATLRTYLLEPAGLGYLEMPKGLLPFHLYGDCARTAFEEHLVAGAPYLADSDGIARYHFTVAAQHEGLFRSLLAERRDILEQQLGVHFEIGFSTQHRSTDSLAVDSKARPFRDEDGHLLFRPAGHGALIENFSRLQADIAFVKNIDNIAHEHLHQVTQRWKQILAGVFLETSATLEAARKELVNTLDAMDSLEAGLDLLERSLALVIPRSIRTADRDTKFEFLTDRLSRPLRVCGMVANEGEPGGGPFWVSEDSGCLAGQIVESAQIDRADPDQDRIVASSTHFNPVDLVCGLRDPAGRAYDLHRQIDPTTAFVARKSFKGQELHSLERPGLWNGAMAGWNTVFVEVPAATFSPVKTIFDLLRPKHQPRE